MIPPSLSNNLDISSFPKPDYLYDLAAPEKDTTTTKTTQFTKVPGILPVSRTQHPSLFTKPQKTGDDPFEALSKKFTELSISHAEMFKELMEKNSTMIAKTIENLLSSSRPDPMNNSLNRPNPMNSGREYYGGIFNQKD